MPPKGRFPNRATLHGLLTHTDVSKRLEGLEALADDPDETAVEAHVLTLVGLLRDSDETIRMMAVTLIDSCAPASLVEHAPKLFALLGSADADTRWSALRVLQLLPAAALEPGLTLLAHAMTDKDEKVVDVCGDILSRKFGEERVMALLMSQGPGGPIGR